jgi:penicillin amidase
VPRRDEAGEWTGWVDPLPRRTASADGSVVTANDRCMPEFDVLAAGFAPPFRADRIAHLLDEVGPLDAEQAVAVLADTTQTAGAPLLALVPADLRPQALAGWDGAMDGSPGAAWYAALRAEVVDRICAAPVLAPLREPSEHGPLYEPWSSLSARVAGALHIILAAEKPFGLDPRALVAEAANAVLDAGSEPTPWPQEHRFWPLHALEQFDLPHTRTAPATPLPGDTDTVRCNAWIPGSTVTVRGSVARYAWDLAERDNSRWVVPLGVSGCPYSPHHTDQHDAWAHGGAVRVVTDWSRLTEEKTCL